MDLTPWPSLEFKPSAPPKHLPDRKECQQIWDTYAMLPHIKEHCARVAHVATALAMRALECGFTLDTAEVEAAALLHDIAKSYTIQHGGSHAQLGATWVMQETHNPVLAQAVLHHVLWPWQDGPLAATKQPIRTPLLVSYADKRIRHTCFTSLESRFEDLRGRYGTDARRLASIDWNYRQSKDLEQALCQALGFANVQELDGLCRV